MCRFSAPLLLRARQPASMAGADGVPSITVSCSDYPQLIVYSRHGMAPSGIRARKRVTVAVAQICWPAAAVLGHEHDRKTGKDGRKGIDGAIGSRSLAGFTSESVASFVGIRSHTALQAKKGVIGRLAVGWDHSGGFEQGFAGTKRDLSGPGHPQRHPCRPH